MTGDLGGESFAAGQVTALVGGDGAGKTTQLRRLAAGGAGIPPERIGYQPGDSGVWRNLSVAENLEFVSAVYRMDPADARTRGDQLLERAGLAEFRGRLAGKLSGGMRQKLGLVLAALHRPDLLLLDEPTTGVDPISRGELWSLISSAAAEGAAVIFSTTYVDEAERASHLYLLDQGAVVATGTTDQVIASVPGHIWESPVSPSAKAEAASASSWRRGQTEYCWTADNQAPAGFQPSPPSLENATIALLLQREESQDSPLSEPQVLRQRGGAPLLRADRVSRRFDSFVALDEVSLHVQPGEVVGLLGGNGAGKTTLMRILLGVESETGGAGELFGQAPTRESRRRLGYVSQGLGLYPALTALENLRFSASVQGVTVPPEAKAFGVAQGNRPVASLPLGTRRQLAFLAATCHHPELLILDEPTSGMDPLASARLWRTLRNQADAGVGILVTTHNMQEASQCDRLVLLSQGRVTAAGTVEDIVGQGTSVLVTCDHWERAFDLLQEAGLSPSVEGRNLRVAQSSSREVESALSSLSFAAQVVPRTLEEAMRL